MPKPLTRRQQEILDFVIESIRAGAPPSIREIGERTGIKSPNGVMCHLRALEKKGYITTGRGKSRGIRLVVPAGYCHCCGQTLPEEPMA